MNGYHSACETELVPSGLELTGGGPVCGSDGGDRASYGGQQAPLVFFGETGADYIDGSRSTIGSRGTRQ